MKCPLLSLTKAQFWNKTGIFAEDCLKEGCAWWGTWTTDKSEEETGCCLPVLTSVMSAIRNEMPHEGQFRK